MELRNSADLRNFLIQQMVDTANGKLEVASARMICNFAQQIYNTVKLEMSFATLKNKGELKSMVEPVEWKSESKTRISHKK
jgi:hypothetical protein